MLYRFIDFPFCLILRNKSFISLFRIHQSVRQRESPLWNSSIQHKLIHKQSFPQYNIQKGKSLNSEYEWGKTVVWLWKIPMLLLDYDGLVMQGAKIPAIQCNFLCYTMLRNKKSWGVLYVSVVDQHLSRKLSFSFIALLWETLFHLTTNNNIKHSTICMWRFWENTWKT